MKRMLFPALLVVLAACGGQSDAPATQTTVLIYGPEEDPRQPVVVRSFEVPDSIGRGTPAQVHVQLEAARPRQQVSVDWYGPDGWLVAYETRPATAASLEFDAPVRSFDEPGKYRAVFRSGSRPLAEETLTVTG